jgi:hypothetical protein
MQEVQRPLLTPDESMPGQRKDAHGLITEVGDIPLR